MAGFVVAAGLAALLALLAGLRSAGRGIAAVMPHRSSRSLAGGHHERCARRDAMRSIPFDKLSAEDRAKVESVLSNISVFRRLPTRVVDCDPDLYLFLVRHPDVVVNIWEVFRISRLKLREIGDGQFQVTESAGATATFEFVYQSHDMHVIYGEGVYQGPLLSRPVKGSGVLVLKTGYVRETNGRYYVTSRLDSFLSIEPAAAELVTKTVSPVLGKTVDNNFVQTLAFRRQPVAHGGSEQPWGAASWRTTHARSARGPRAIRGAGRRHARKRAAAATEKASPKVASQSADQATR